MNEIDAPAGRKAIIGREFPAIVKSVHDEQFRVRVQVLGWFDGVPEQDLPYAEYRLPVGARPNDGSFTPCDVGDYVWVDFPHGGDTRRPRITGGMHYCPGGVPNLPTELSGTTNCATAQHGILIETVDSGENGAYRITQRNSGTVVEIDDIGNIKISSAQNVSVECCGTVSVKSTVETSIEASSVHLNP